MKCEKDTHFLLTEALGPYCGAQFPEVLRHVLLCLHLHDTFQHVRVTRIKNRRSFKISSNFHAVSSLDLSIDLDPAAIFVPVP